MLRELWELERESKLSSSPEGDDSRSDRPLLVPHHLLGVPAASDSAGLWCTSHPPGSVADGVCGTAILRLKSKNGMLCPFLSFVMVCLPFSRPKLVPQSTRVHPNQLYLIWIQGVLSSLSGPFASALHGVDIAKSCALLDSLSVAPTPAVPGLHADSKNRNDDGTNERKFNVWEPTTSKHKSN